MVRTSGEGVGPDSQQHHPSPLQRSPTAWRRALRTWCAILTSFRPGAT
eukprot:CAMPEP_0118884008 /NCGR_PEP_ID=MMETSP1163-20130328/22963_1 /TAXON_ID=124430 /ORGANISM="Phaeomonas parva, Strain CCMP2877" /LENGTH=47 /DNA_ID= /DNA_START= /DNA_END= /DNA_ORIENTATION=